MKKLSILVFLALTSACTIIQNVEPAEIVKGEELCIIENPDVREGFLKELKLALSKKGVEHRVVSQETVPESCEWTARYLAKWSWDLSLYMSYAEIKIYHNGNLDGHAIYDSTGGSASSKKFIDAEPKIRELVNELMQFKSASLFYRTFG